MKPLDALAQLEANLSHIRRVEAAWCVRRLQAARTRLKKGQPADQVITRIMERMQSSGEQVARRREQAPRPTYDEALPITAHREQILAAIQGHPVIVVAGETGSGKTTQLPKLCLEAGLGTRGLIGCTQPRRIAARAMAERVAEELGDNLGGVVGYQVRFREQVGADSYIKFMTDGILLAETTHDHDLDAYDAIIIDEAHERSLNIDFLLGYLKQLLARRPDLKLIITSATIDTEKFSRHFGDAPVIEVSGRGYPVDVIYQPLEESESADRQSRNLYQGIADAVGRLSRVDRHGDILVFLSGEREIHEAADFLGRQKLAHTEVLPLYARLSASEQRRVFHPGPQRRIILSTNVAETSLTVPRIRFVIDTGMARISRYAHRSRIQRLPIEPVSQASANQRMGRCGRLGPGTCVRLYAEDDFNLRPEFTEPEILRTSLASVILRMLTMRLGSVEDFPFIDPPAPHMINDAYHLLFELGAVDKRKKPTALGARLARWPLDVRLARMVIEGAEQNCLEDLLVLVAALSIQDPRERPLDAQQAADEAHQRFADDTSDFVALLKLWAHLRSERKARTGNQFRKLCRREFLSWQRVLEWFDLYQQLRDQAREQGLALKGGHGDYEQVHKALLSGLLSLCGQRNPEDPGFTGARNRSFHIFPGSGLFGHSPRWLMAAEIVETTKPYARMCARIEPQWIEQQGAHLLKRHTFDPHWSRRSGRVVAWEQVSLFGLVLVEKRRVDYGRLQPAEARQIFIRHALVAGDLDSRATFLQHNRQVREEAERLEHKRRQRDVLVDDAALEAFFDARLPAEVHSAKALAAWLESMGEEGIRQLQLSHELLLRSDAGQAPQDLYPDELQAGGHGLPLSYVFEPGHAADGVTVSVPLELLNTLDEKRLQWLVPGLLREKLVELVRTLPKPLRRVLTPAPQFVDAALRALPAAGSEGLLTCFSEALAQLTGTPLSAQDFDEAALPVHLRFRIEVLDEHGQPVAVSRDVAELRARLGQVAQRQFMDRQGSGFNQDGLHEWSFETLPLQMETETGVSAWPAVVDQQDAVGLRLFDMPEEAAWAHLQGVQRLLSLQLADKFNYLHKHHGIAARTLLAWTPIGDPAELVADLGWMCLCSTAGDDAVRVRDAQSFADLLQGVRSRLGLVFQQQAGHLATVLEALHGVNRTLEGSVGRNWPDSAADLAQQLQDLFYPGFLLDIEAQRLADYNRYLEAMRLRIERLKTDPQKDAHGMALVQPYWQRYLDHIAAGHDYDETLDAYRWLLEEYRISVFAQQLGTREKVSPKRLDQAWSAVTGAA